MTPEVYPNRPVSTPERWICRLLMVYPLPWNVAWKGPPLAPRGSQPFARCPLGFHRPGGVAVEVIEVQRAGQFIAYAPFT